MMCDKLSDKLRELGKMNADESVTYSYDEYIDMFTQAKFIEDRLDNILGLLEDTYGPTE